MCIDKVNTDLNRIVSERLAKDDELFFVDTSVVCSKHGKTIIKRKSLQGVQDNDRILIRPIFEAIDIVSSEIAIARLLDMFALFSLREGRQLSEFEYCSVQISDDVIVLGKGNGRTAIYNLDTSDFLHQMGDYDEFNLKDFSTEYVWARRNMFYDYIHRATGRVISIPGVIMAYDTKRGIFGLNKHNKVCKFNEKGVENNAGLRQAVQKEGGYLALRNYTYNIEHITDIYGNILNI